MSTRAKDRTSQGTDVLPRSVAVIMDGNGRWARKRGFLRIRGHRKGVDAVRTTVTECARLGLEALYLYAFSTENWSRPKAEVDFLMKTLGEFLVAERPTLMKNNVRLTHCGRIEALPADIRGTLHETEALTKDNTGLTLCLALSYGGRQEVVDAAREVARAAMKGEIDVEDIDERAFAARLYRPELPDPDLLIRTAGQMRVSNFLLWQISYAEFYVTETCWPDFDEHELQRAFEAYARRDRRYGRISREEAEEYEGNEKSVRASTRGPEISPR
ncbi:MAG: isoprenyl transferase [Planctomycetes bacterium]|nr:isoprenyl transferase [Planctomycetota bacterium]